jgi:hypothetical protein
MLYPAVFELTCRVILSQEGTIDDTLNTDQVIRLLTTMLGSSRVSAHRDMSICTWMDQTIGRGDDARLVYLPDILKPELISVIGMHPLEVGDFSGVLLSMPTAFARQ